jgi:predicted PurR-regulated permease PerM
LAGASYRACEPTLPEIVERLLHRIERVALTREDPVLDHLVHLLGQTLRRMGADVEMGRSSFLPAMSLARTASEATRRARWHFVAQGGLPLAPGLAVAWKDSEIRALRALVLAVVGATALVLAPVWVSIVLAAWIADVLQPLVTALSRVLGGRRRGAAAIIVLFAAAVLVLLVGAGFVMADGVRDLLERIRDSLEGHGSLAGALLGSDGNLPQLGWKDWAELASRHGGSAWRTVSAIARASTSAALDVVVFVVALYAISVEGERAYAWLEERAPIPKDALARFAAAFRETGRGLLVAGVGTALAQGLVATITYLVIGVPRALVLGVLTAVCAVVPVVGTGLVWIPVSAGLAANGAWVRAALVLVSGVGIHSLIDNLVRPALARYGRLALPIPVVLIAMLGGAAAIGAPGVLLGPLVVRLSTEALSLARERGIFGERS